MITNAIFRECLESISDKDRNAFTLSFEIAEKIVFLLREKGMSQKDLAIKMNKRESEVSRWLTGRHNFTTRTIAAISDALGENIIQISREAQPRL